MLFAAETVNAQDSFKRQEVFVGYTHKRTDFDIVDDPQGVFPSTNGLNVSYTVNVTKYVGLKGEFAAGFTNASVTAPAPPIRSGGCYMCTPYRRTGRVLTSPAPSSSVWDVNAREMSYMGGIQVKNNASDARVKPFTHVLAGIVRQNAKLKDDGVFVDDFIQNSFSMVLGAGVDVKVSDGVSVRVIQFDYNPIFSKPGALLLSDKTQHTFRISTGLVFH